MRPQTKSAAADTNGSTPNMEVVTPGLAKRWLDNATSNRRLKEARVAAMTRDMLDGNWRPNNPHNIICFNKKGQLMDGRHRLTALVRSTKTVDMKVARNVPDEVMDVIDTGTPRSLADILAIRGVTNSRTVAATIVWCWRYENRQLRAGGHFRPSHSELLRWLNENPRIMDAIPHGKQLALRVSISYTITTGFYYEASQLWGEETVDAFYDEVGIGADLEIGSPTLALRNWLNKQAAKRDRPSTVVYAASLIKAFNAWVEGRPINTLSWRGFGPKREAFPTIVAPEETEEDDA